MVTWLSIFGMGWTVTLGVLYEGCVCVCCIVISEIRSPSKFGTGLGQYMLCECFFPSSDSLFHLLTRCRKIWVKMPKLIVTWPQHVRMQNTADRSSPLASLRREGEGGGGVE